MPRQRCTRFGETHERILEKIIVLRGFELHLEPARIFRLRDEHVFARIEIEESIGSPFVYPDDVVVGMDLELVALAFK